MIGTVDFEKMSVVTTTKDSEIITTDSTRDLPRSSDLAHYLRLPTDIFPMLAFEIIAGPVRDYNILTDFDCKNSADQHKINQLLI